MAEELLVVGQVEALVDQMAEGVPGEALGVIVDDFDVSNYRPLTTRGIFSYF